MKSYIYRSCIDGSVKITGRENGGVWLEWEDGRTEWWYEGELRKVSGNIRSWRKHGFVNRQNR